MKLDRLDRARFPIEPARGLGERVPPVATRLELPFPAPPSLLPEFLDGIGWAAAVWVCGLFLREVLR